MPTSTEIQRKIEGRFYSKKPPKKKFEQSKELDKDNSLKISQGQILTKTALGICLFLTVVDSVETKKQIFSNLPSYSKKTSNKIGLPNDTNPSLNNLIIASRNGDIGVVKDIIKAGIDINQKSKNGKIALRLAVQNGHIEVVNALIEAGAVVDATDKNGVTSLQIASQKGHLKIVEALIRAGAKIDHKNKFGFNAKFYALDNGYTEIVNFLTKTKRSIRDKAKNIEVLTCPDENRYDKIPLKQSIQPEEPTLPQPIQQREQTQQPVESEQSAQISYTLAVTSSLVMLGGLGVMLLPQIQQPAQNIQPVVQKLNDEEIILKASYLLDPINLYLDKLPLFTLEEIKPLEWKIKNDKFVLELEHQPEDLKREIQELLNENFREHIESITEENENKSIITFNPEFTTIVKNSNEIILQDLNFIALQSIKDQFELLSARKNQQFEEKYGKFFMGLDFIEENKMISIGQKHFINAEDNDFKELMHFNLLNNFGLLVLNDALKNQLQLSISVNGKISHHEDFYGEEDESEIVKKYNKRTERSEAGKPRDSVHKGIRIGERFVDPADPISGENKIKYFVRFPEKPGDFALACTTTNREIKFFEAKTNDQFEIQVLRPINREDAVILFERIRLRQAPAPVLEIGAQLNQFQNQELVRN